MAKKIKKVSISALDDVIKNNYEATKTVEWHGIDVVIKKTLSLSEMLKFVDSVTKSCFEEGTNRYLPEVRDFAIRSNIMDTYANFALPEKMEHQYEIVMCSGAVEMILPHINQSQFNEMLRAIDSKIDNLASANIQVMTMKFDKLVEAFDTMQTNVSKLFEGITKDDMNKLVEMASTNNFTDEGLVKAYMEHKQEK